MDEVAAGVRTGDRRRAQQPFEGPERRLQGRQPPTGSPLAPPELAALSDIDLCRAWLRKSRQPVDQEGTALAAEMTRRRLIL